MEATYFLAGLFAGLFLVLFVFALSDSMQCNSALEECQDTKDCSAYKEQYQSTKELVKLQRDTFSSFTEYLFSVKNPKDYLSHLSPCMNKDNRTARDDCVIDFVLETNDYRACALITNTEIMRSCLSMGNTSSEQ